ncbi:MAG TPA: VOC family protein, partial [Acidimicrobiales bacterium]
MAQPMTARLLALCIDANDPLRLGRFWADALDWELGGHTDDEVDLVPTDGTSFRIVLRRVPERKLGRNRIHLDLTSTSLDDQRESVSRLV